MNKDWTGNKQSVYSIIGAENYSFEERQSEDYYATEPKAVELLLRLEDFSDNIWECACGEGNISKVLEGAGYIVKSTDLYDRNFGESGINFLKCIELWGGDIITNPPYKYAKEFIEKSLDLIGVGNKIAMFLKIQFLEGQSRKKLFIKHPPKTVWISSSRLTCLKNNKGKREDSLAVAYAWYIWEKGFNGITQLKWFN